MFNTKKRQLKKYTILLFAVAQFIAAAAFAQDNLSAITASFYNYQQNNLQEKIFVHTDKGFYVTGEIAWFKLYNVDAVFNKPLNISKVAYIEILDAVNKPVLQAKIALENGEGNGSLYIPLTVNSGNYKLRAYTNWLKNFGPDYFFEKNITIINTQKKSSAATVNAGSKNDIQFFPEGGNLVAGLQSKVAFKAVDKNGKGIDFKAAIIDNTNTILKFEPIHDGMGNFYFTPQGNHSYKAVITLEGGETVTKELPQVYEQGYVMNVKDAGTGKISITVQTNITEAREMYLFVHTDGSVKSAMAGNLQNGTAEFVINKSMLGNGISHITIFNGEKQPVCERLYFKKTDETLQLKLSTDKPVYAEREKVNISIETSNAKSGSSSLSMSVYRLDSLQSVDVNTIDTYLLLTCGLKGPIENPQYYFTNTDEQATQDLDNLMLTNGWRRFKWQNILQKTAPVFSYAPEFKGHIVTGKVTNAQTGKGQNYIETFLSVPGLKTQFAPSSADEAGTVKFEMKKMYGSSQIIVQTNTVKDTMYSIDIDNPFSNQFSSGALPPFYLPEIYPGTLLQQSISMQVQNIYSGNELRQFSLPAADTSSFYLNADARYLLDDYTRFKTTEEVMREYVSFVNVIKRDGKYHFPVLDFAAKKLFINDPLVLLDGVPVFNFNKFLQFDPLKLKSLEVLNSRYFFGGSSFDGILNWQTYNGDLANYELDPHAVVIDYEGLQLQREFYAPVYSTKSQFSIHIPDFRSTLLWSPNIKMPAVGKQAVSFYTSDLAGKYAAIIQGLSASGLSGSSTVFFEVKK